MFRFIATLCLLVTVTCGSAIAAADPPVDAVACPQCNGAGDSACSSHCKEGKIRCPATCLKKDDPGWVPGPEGKTVQYFPSKKKGVTGSLWVSTGHIGQIVVYEDGLAVLKGVCPKCKGTSVIDCQTCKGTGKQTCGLCKGAKQVAKGVADDFAAKIAAKKKAATITLTDGRVLEGKILGRTTEKVIIKTTDGKMIEVTPAEIVENPPENVEGK